MDKEMKVTYGIIAVLIIALAGVAFFLQPAGGKSPAPEKTIETKESVKPQANQQPVTATTTPTVTTTHMEQQQSKTAIITTNKGVIEITFGNDTPVTVKNFQTLAAKDFYTGVRFHRVIKGFMIQAGDPLSKDPANQAAWGTGGPGYKFNDELKGDEKYTLGTVAMANAGPNTNGSQFFIVTANPGVGLPASYTVFGHVTKGIEVAEAIQNVKTGPSDRPIEDVIIEKIELK